MALFRQFFDETSSTCTYFLADPGSGEAVIIDPVAERVPEKPRLIDTAVPANQQCGLLGPEAAAVQAAEVVLSPADPATTAPL